MGLSSALGVTLGWRPWKTPRRSQTWTQSSTYTDSEAERDGNVRQGWEYEEVGWYGLRSSTSGTGGSGSGATDDTTGVDFLIRTVDGAYRDEDEANGYVIAPSHYLSGVAYVIRDSIVSQGVTGDLGKGPATLPAGYYSVTLTKDGYRETKGGIRVEGGHLMNYIFYLNRA